MKMESAILVAQAATEKPVHKRYVWLEETNEWGTPSEHGAGEDHTMAVRRWHFYLFQPREDNLMLRYEFRRDMFEQFPSMVWCPGTPNLQRLNEWQNVFKGDEGVGHYIGTAARNQQNILDTPRSTFIADVDGLVMNNSVLENDDRLIPMWLQVLADAELDILIRPQIIHLSSSHGLQDECMMKAHIEWKLREPLYLSQQEELAAYCNQQFDAAGYGDNVFDLSIYEPSRLLISTPPELVDLSGNPMRGPRLQRVKYYRTGGPQVVDIPDINMSDHEPSRVKSYVRGTNITPCDGVKERWIPGVSCNESIRDVYWRHMYKALGDKIERRHEYAEAARAFCESRLRGIPKKLQSEDDMRRRIKQLNDEHAERWNYGLQRLSEQASPPPEIVNVDTYADAGDKIGAILRERVAEGVKYKPSMFSKPRLDIIGGYPGIGKTYHARQAIKKNEPYDDYIIDFATPLRKLSHEIAEEILQENAVPPDRLQQFDGRAYHCHPDMDERCSKVEAVGVSPRTVVCPTCPFKETCPWPKQKLSPKKGVRVMQHAHLTSIIASLKSGSDDAADLYIIDENPVDAIGTVHFSLSLSRLNELTDKLELRDERGFTDWGATNDAVIARKALLRAIEGVGVGRIPTEYCKPLGASLEAFMRAERESIKAQYQIKLFELAKDDGFEPESKKAQELVAIKDSAEMFYQLARAIKASLDNHRDYVIGCRFLKDSRLDIQLKGDIPMAMKERPIIVLDATSSGGEIERMLFSKTHEVRYHPAIVRAEHVHLTQYVDRGFSKRMLGCDKHFVNALEERLSTLTEDQINQIKRGSPPIGTRMLQQIVTVIRDKARRFPSVLVVCNKDVERALKMSYTWTSNVSFEHNKNVRGINKYKNHAAVVQVGYHQIPHYELENRAEGLVIDEGRDILRLPPNRRIPYVPQWRLYRKPDGSIGQMMVKHPQHPDPVVEMLRYQEHDADNIQALYRVRPLSRTAANPVDITVFGTYDTGMVIDDIRFWDDGFNDEEYYQSWIDEDGITFRPASDMADLIYNGIFTMVGRDKRLKIFRYQTRHEDQWKTWRFYYHGDKQLCRVHTKNEQTEEAVIRLIKKVCGIDVARAAPAETAYDRATNRKIVNQRDRERRKAKNEHKG